MNFAAVRHPRDAHHSSPYVPVALPKLCKGSGDTPDTTFIRFGFCCECGVKIELNKDGAAKRHYAETGLPQKTRWNQ